MSRLSAWCVIVYAALALRGNVPAQQPGAKPAPDAAQAAATELLLADAALEKHLYDGAVKRYIDYLSRHGAIADPRSVNSLLVAAEKEDWRFDPARLHCIPSANLADMSRRRGFFDVAGESVEKRQAA